MKHILLTCTDLMAVQFFIEHIKNWAENGFFVELVCSPVGDRVDDIKTRLKKVGNISIRTVQLHRTPLSLSNVKGYTQLRDYITAGKYDLIITNEPVIGLVTRLAARNNDVKVIYITHGFHFYKGASFLNNLVYRSIERYAARYTDVLVTINSEDQEAAKEFNLRKGGCVQYIPGIGVSLKRFHPVTDSAREYLRNKLGIAPDDVAVVLIGELNTNKNQQVLIRGLQRCKNPKLKLYLFGKGAERKKLETLSAEMGIVDQIRFMGYRTDLPKILPAFDIGASASLREGLGLNLIEEMASGLPILASNNRGHRDVVESEGGYLFNVYDANDVAEKIAMLCSDVETRRKMGQFNLTSCRRFDIESVKPLLLNLIEAHIE